jgi:hypothetical protein
MKKLIVALFALLTLSSCASYQQKRSDELMQETVKLHATGKVFDACRSALIAFDINQGNEAAKKFLQDNLGRAIDQKTSEIESSNVSIDSLGELRSKIDELEKLQADSKRLGISQTNARDTSLLRRTAELKATNSLLSDLDDKIAQGLTKESADLARKYKGNNLANTDRFAKAIGKMQLQLPLGTSDEIRQAIGFNGEFVNYIDKPTAQQIYPRLFSTAQTVEAYDKKLALDVYKYLGTTNYESDAIKNKIRLLKNALILMICVSDVENKTDEMLSFSSIDFAKSIKKAVDNESALTEVMVEDSCMADLRDRSIGYDYIATNKTIPVKFESSIRYILATKVSGLRASAQPASVVTRNANWQSGSTGSAISAGLKEYSAYGSYKVQYYQYDEYSAKSSGRIVFDYALFDTKSGKIVVRDRGEASVEDALTWAENPMAVGIINKIPATVYPEVIEGLIYKKRPLKSESEIKADLAQKMVSIISDRIMSNIKQ